MATDAPGARAASAATPRGFPLAHDDREPSFPRIRREAYRAVGVREATLLVVPWGPRLDVQFHPLDAPGAPGGTVRVYGRTPGGQILLAAVPIPSPAAPVLVTTSGACDHYVITATLGTPPPPGSKSVESYVYACAYAER